MVWRVVYWTICRVFPTTQLVKGLNWTELKVAYVWISHANKWRSRRNRWTNTFSWDYCVYGVQQEVALFFNPPTHSFHIPGVSLVIKDPSPTQTPLPHFCFSSDTVIHLTANATNKQRLKSMFLQDMDWQRKCDMKTWLDRFFF